VQFAQNLVECPDGGGRRRREKESNVLTQARSQAIQSFPEVPGQKCTFMHTCSMSKGSKERKGEEEGEGKKRNSPNHVSEQPLCGPVASRL